MTRFLFSPFLSASLLFSHALFAAAQDVPTTSSPNNPASGLRGAGMPQDTAGGKLPPRVGHFMPPGVYKDGTIREGKPVDGHLSATAVTLSNVIDLADCRRGLEPAQVVETFEDSTVITNKVVKLTGVTSDGTEFDWCSGTLVAPLVIATAAHCVYDTAANTWYVHNSGSFFSYFNVYLQFNVGTSDTVFQKRTSVTVSAFNDFINLASWGDSLAQGSDIAVIKLSSAFSRVTPATWFDVATGSAAMRTVIGFPANIQNGEKMIMDTTIDPVVRTAAYPRIQSVNFSNEGGMSGGGTFSRATNKLIAITSGAIIDGCPGYYTDVNSFYALRILVALYATVTCTSKQCSAV